MVRADSEPRRELVAAMVSLAAMVSVAVTPSAAAKKCSAKKREWLLA
jgi:hypothetical protein